MPPFLIVRIVRAANKVRREEFEAERWIAWHIAALGRAKKMPKLKDFVAPAEKRPERGIDEASIKARFRMHNDRNRQS